jgi:hypothetical protein
MGIEEEEGHSGMTFGLHGRYFTHGSPLRVVFSRDAVPVFAIKQEEDLFDVLSFSCAADCHFIVECCAVRSISLIGWMTAIRTVCGSTDLR